VIRWIAKLFGYRPVYILDHDGDVSKAYAFKTSFGYVCNHPITGRKLLLMADGSYHGPNYVSAWRLA
jgi:hypothetical protein